MHIECKNALCIHHDLTICSNFAAILVWACEQDVSQWEKSFVLNDQ